ncbi:hypothetical protein [Nocardioides jejuensis]|uniref:Uncharacterized protein n=1 Tax=Nocardioides jejuensis TaxID=2502782 RepID=A0A4R1BY58_9ACTN|nr:hypothetical protein [Nocardioides jejuensis]TCJ20830.1 hypothetical protein EPD65_16095 [Nocardioides jejuensis]TCJ23009.1 hypothetical protein EPD65_11650 [Nocardioides jejuensis]
MNAYTATAEREGNWWVLDVDGVGVTQCARLTEARAQIRGLIEAVEDRDVPEDTHIDVRLIGPVDAALDEARQAASVAETFRDLAAAKMRHVAWRLVNELGLKQAEAAVVLDVSKQRMTQLLADYTKIESPLNSMIDTPVHEAIQVMYVTGGEKRDLLFKQQVTGHLFRTVYYAESDSLTVDALDAIAFSPDEHAHTV